MKTALLKFPDNSRDPIACADWMELYALTAPEHRCSIATVERNLTRLSPYRDSRTTQQIDDVERTCTDILSEIRRREFAAASAYPFRLHGSELKLLGEAKDYVPYVFCLCLSWFGWTHRKGRKLFPRRMFEDLSKYAAQQFVGGEALRFGAPRTDLPASFKRALLALCLAIGEGSVRPVQGPIHAQDDSLDLVAWRDFPDRAEGKLFLVGQCASGGNWESKKRELDADAFFEDWFSDKPPSARSMRIGLFIPHQVPKSKWIAITRRT